MNIEIERKFLLKSLPKREADIHYLIDQYYIKNIDGVWERARRYSVLGTDDFFYLHTVKKPLSKGVNLEDERNLTKEEFDRFVYECNSELSDSRFIKKERKIYFDGDLKWEVDNFLNDYRLIIAEIEIPSKKFKVEIPKYIEEVLLMEVTGMKKFNNRSLSLPITSKLNMS